LEKYIDFGKAAKTSVSGVLIPPTGEKAEIIPLNLTRIMPAQGGGFLFLFPLHLRKYFP